MYGLVESDESLFVVMWLVLVLEAVVVVDNSLVDFVESDVGFDGILVVDVEGTVVVLSVVL